MIHYFLVHLVLDEGAKANILIWVEFEISSAISISEAAKFSTSKLSGFSLPSSVNPEELARKCGIVVGLSLSIVSNSSNRVVFEKELPQWCFVYYPSTFYRQMSNYVSVSYTFLHPDLHTHKRSWISPHHPIFLSSYNQRKY